MFEQGDGTKLNDEAINKYAARFGIDLTTPAEVPAPARSLPAFSAVGSGFCPNPDCPSNHAYRVGERTLLRPERLEADPVGGEYCALCGELLERHCPECGRPVHAGAVCSYCGHQYVVKG